MRRRHRHPADEVGVSIGHDVGSGMELWASLEDSWLIIGPPRVGKDVSLIIPTTMAWPGPLAVTSNRPDTLAATAFARAQRGPVLGFDPQGLSVGVDALRWSPVRGCDEPSTAIIRGRALAAGAGLAATRNPDADYWEAQTSAVLRCYLHAAAVAGLGPAELLRWSHSPQARQPQQILRSDGSVAAWADELAAQSAADSRMRDSVWSGVRRAFDCLADPRVLDACNPAPGEQFDPEAFLGCCGTLYLLGATGAQLSVAPLITALVEDLVEAARAIADRSPGGRIDPPFGLLLNEAANICPLPALPALVSSGGGRGLPAMVVLQSPGQARHRWGEAQADALWDAANVKLIFGGLAQADDLSRISRLAGDIDQTTLSRSGGAGGDAWSTGIRRVPVLGVQDLRYLPAGHAVLFYRHLPPVLARLSPWWKRPLANQVWTSQTTTMGSR